MDLKKYKELIDKIERIKQDNNRLEGRLIQLNKQLREDYGVDSVEEANKLLRRMKKDIEEKSRSIEELYNKIMGKLNEIEN